MFFIDSKMLQQRNERGWIPGPLEEKKDFEKRVEDLNHFFSNPPSDIDHFLTDRDWSRAKEITKHLYDFSPDWILAYYNNDKLSFFQGAATWISEKEDLRLPLIQLREKFEEGRLFKFYYREEVLAHEAVHAARMQFDEPLYEEIFAYKTSPGFFRRFFGPLFQRPWEAYFFIALLFIPLTIEILLFLGIEVGYFIYLSLIPAAFFAYLLLRLLALRSVLAIALHRMKQFLEHPSKNWALAFRLKDSEIFRFALQRKKKLTEYILKQSSLRWNLLKEIYFKKTLK